MRTVRDTPREVIDILIKKAELHPECFVLEPSAGNGAILEVLTEHRHCETMKVEGGVILNSVMKVKPEWFDVITEEEFNDERKDPKYGNPGTHTPKAKEELMVKPGDFIRKTNWEFFKEWPAIKVTRSSNKNLKPRQISVNGNIYDTRNIQILTEAEYNEIMLEWDKTHVAAVLDGKLETVHYREDTGEPKMGRTERDALKYVFTYNKRYPGKDMNAYECPFCKEVHCGKVPKEETYDWKVTDFLPEENMAVELSNRIAAMMEKYWVKLDWHDMYENHNRVEISNKEWSQSYEIVATQRHFNGGWVQLFEIIPWQTLRYDMSHPLRQSWCVLNRGMRSVYIPSNDVMKAVYDKIVAQGKNKFKTWLRSLFTWKKK